MARVGIILVNWNGLQDTLTCVASLEAQAYRDFTIIVVDNHSCDDPGMITTRYPDVVLIRNSDNLGFGAANNIGLHKAAELGAEYCWILNNDTEVAADCLARLVEALDRDRDAAAVGHPIDYYDDPMLRWFNGGRFSHDLPKHHGYLEPIRVGDAIDVSTEYLTGCSFLARTDVLTALDGFDEKYFCYVEDVDLSLRIKQRGLGIGYVPEALVWHKVSRSAGVRSPTKLYYKHRNMLYFLRKFERPASAKVRWWLFSARSFTSLLLKHHRAKAAWYLLRGLIDGAVGRMGRLEA